MPPAPRPPHDGHDHSHGESISERINSFWAAHADMPNRLAAPIRPTDPLVAAREALTVRDLLGHTARDWIHMHTASALLGLRADPASPADLVAETLRLDAMLGVRVTPAQVAAMEAQAATLPADLRDAVARLVREAADAHEAQMALVPLLTARLPEPGAPVPDDWTPMTIAERDATHARALRLVAAMNEARFVVQRMGPSEATSYFADPEGLVVVAVGGDNIHARSGNFPDPVVLVDTAGNDIYHNSAGGACPDPFSFWHRCNALAVSLVLDVDGNDVYDYDGPPAAVQGAGSFGAIGILLDVAGNDQYLSRMTRTTPAFFNYIDGGAQGFGQAGVGIQIDATGDDVFKVEANSTGWSTFANGQGYGGAGGLGVSADGSGRDQWLSYGIDIPSGDGFMGVYTDGVGIYAGVGLMSDTGLGDDVYWAFDYGATTDYYAQGFGGFGGVGIFYEDGGDDDYTAVSEARNPWINPLLNCAYGTGSIGGTGIFIEVSGNDRYFGDTKSPRRAETMNEGLGSIIGAYGLFVDLSGDDGHFMEAHGAPGSSTAGRGVLLSGGANKNIVGNYLDIGGNDVYTGIPDPTGRPRANDGTAWIAGADINIPPNIGLGL